MTPEARALAVWELIKADPFGDYPLKAIETAIAAAERAAYERAAKEISCACLDKPECRHPHACCREDVASILALIPQPKEPT